MHILPGFLFPVVSKKKKKEKKGKFGQVATTLNSSIEPYSHHSYTLPIKWC